MPKLEISEYLFQKNATICCPGDCIIVDNDIYIIAAIDEGDFRLIGLKNGNRYNNRNVGGYSQKDVLEIFNKVYYSHIAYIPSSKCKINFSVLDPIDK